MRKQKKTISLSQEVLEKALVDSKNRKWSLSVLIEEALLKFLGK